MHCNRRSFLRTSFAAAAAGRFARVDAAGQAAGQSIDDAIGSCLKHYDVPGFSIAYARGKRLLFAKGYGEAERGKHQPVTPANLFRIASCSKAFTSASIFTLVEAGKLRTDQLVFGPEGILSEVKLGRHPDWLQAITVRELLTHTAGGWSNKEQDPMFRGDTDAKPAVFLQQTVSHYALDNKPGEAYAYSNFGYFLLGRIIERISGQAYGEYVSEHVLKPADITDMRLGTKRMAPDEVHYYDFVRNDISPTDVPIELHDANGGWLATPSDLVRFMAALFAPADGSGVSPLLMPETLRELTRGSAPNPRYACGWSISTDGGNFFHSGSLPGTTSLMVHRRDGLMWALVANARDEHREMERAFDRLGWDVSRAIRS